VSRMGWHMGERKEKNGNRLAHEREKVDKREGGGAKKKGRGSGELN